MAVSRLDIVAKIKLEGLRQLDQLNQRVRTFSRSIRGASFVLKAFGLTFAAVFTGALIRGFFRQQTELSNSLARTRFALAGMGGEMEKNLAIVNTFANEMQRAGLASANLAREVSAKVITSLKSQEQATRFARAALIGHKIQLFDARAASVALASSTDENTSAFRNFLAALGIAAPEFASLDSLIENFIRRNEEAAKAITPFAREWERFVAIFRNLAAKLAGVIGGLLTPAFRLLNNILTDPRQAFANFLSSFGGFWLSVGALFMGNIQEINNIWVQWFVDMTTAAIEGVKTFVGEIVKGFGIMVDKIKIKLGEALDVFLDWVDANTIAATGLIILFSVGLTFAIQAVAAAITATLIPALIKMVTVFVLKVIPAVFSFVVSLLTKAIPALFTFIATLGLANIALFALGFVILALVILIILNWQKVKAVTIFVWNAIVDFLSTKMLQAFNVVSTFLTNIRTTWETQWGKIKAFFFRIIDSIAIKIGDLVDSVEKQINRIKTFIQDARDAAAAPINIVRNIITNVRTFFTGNKQLGGTVQAGKSFIVGERGAELFVPSQSGTIIPNQRLGGGGDLTIVIQGNTFMSDEEGARKVGDMIVKRLQLVHRFGLTT